MTLTGDLHPKSKQIPLKSKISRFLENLRIFSTEQKKQRVKKIRVCYKVYKVTRAEFLARSA